MPPAEGTDLTPEGRRRIEVAAELFAGTRLDLVVANPRRRAMGTADIIAARQRRLVNFSAHDALEERLSGPRFARLRRVLEAGASGLAEELKNSP